MDLTHCQHCPRQIKGIKEAETFTCTCDEDTPYTQ